MKLIRSSVSDLVTNGIVIMPEGEICLARLWGTHGLAVTLDGKGELIRREEWLRPRISAEPGRIIVHWRKL